MTAHWEHFGHGADIGVRGIGASKEAAFEQAAAALTAVVTDLSKVAARECVAVECAAPDDELLLADWLNHIVYEMATRHMLFSRFEVSIQDGRLRGRMWGEPTDRTRHCPAVEVKGATYTELRVARAGDNWIAQTIVDV